MSSLWAPVGYENCYCSNLGDLAQALCMLSGDSVDGLIPIFLNISTKIELNNKKLHKTNVFPPPFGENVVRGLATVEENISVESYSACESKELGFF